MSTIVTRNVADMPETDRRSIEGLIGHALEQSQRVFIIVDKFSPSSGPGHRTRR